MRLVAKALGLEHEAPKRLRALATPDGLRAAIVQRAFSLKIKGVPTPSRLRAALAAVALERAFGNQIKSGLAGKLGLSAKAGRLLAAQLAQEAARFRYRRPPGRGTCGRAHGRRREPTSRRCGSPCCSAISSGEARRRKLRSARQGRARRASPLSQDRSTCARRRAAASQSRAGRSSPASPQEVRRHRGRLRPGLARQPQGLHQPRLASHAREARRLGPLGDRVQVHADRGAPRRGSLALANADLKDNSSLKELQESAVVYKNAVFHFIRVDG